MKSRQPGQAGFTLVELSIASVVLVVMSAVIVQSLRGLTAAQSSVQSQAKVASLVERVGVRIEVDVGHAAKLFGEGEDARAVLAQLDFEGLGGGAAPLADSRLPVARMTGVFEPDPADAVETGNLLLLARRDSKVAVESAPETVAPPVSMPRRIDLLRIVAWYVHDGGESGLDLSRFASVRLARLQDLQGLGDPARRARAARGLIELGVQMAWDPSTPTVFFALDEEGNAQPLAAGTLVPCDVDDSDPGVLSRRHVGLARNGTVAPRVPRFARATAVFPHGFELKHDGNGSGDLVLLRMVVTTPTGPQRAANAAEVVRQIAFRAD